jgi:hypothetical protein
VSRDAFVDCFFIKIFLKLRENFDLIFLILHFLPHTGRKPAAGTQTGAKAPDANGDVDINDLTLLVDYWLEKTE